MCKEIIINYLNVPTCNVFKQNDWALFFNFNTNYGAFKTTWCIIATFCLCKRLYQLNYLWKFLEVGVILCSRHFNFARLLFASIPNSRNFMWKVYRKRLFERRKNEKDRGNKLPMRVLVVWWLKGDDKNLQFAISASSYRLNSGLCFQTKNVALRSISWNLHILYIVLTAFQNNSTSCPKEPYKAILSDETIWHFTLPWFSSRNWKDHNRSSYRLLV